MHVVCQQKGKEGGYTVAWRLQNLCLGDLAELVVALEEVMEQTAKMNHGGLPRLAFIILSCKGSS